MIISKKITLFYSNKKSFYLLSIHITQPTAFLDFQRCQLKMLSRLCTKLNPGRQVVLL